MSVLEAVVAEIHKNEQSVLETSTLQESTRKDKKKKKEMDEDMEKYVQELKMKEQDIQQKV